MNRRIANTIPARPVDHDATDDEIINYLNEALAAGEAPAVAMALGHLVRRRGGMLWLSRLIGRERSALHRALSGNTIPSLDTVLLTASALGLELSIRRTEAWHKSDSPQESDGNVALSVDPKRSYTE